MNTETEIKTQDNTPCGSYDEKEEENQFLRSYFAQQKSLNAKSKSRSNSKSNDDDIIMYHINPVKVIKANPDLAGKVKQAFLFCQQWKHLTTENSIQLPLGEISFQKKLYVGGYCLMPECGQTQYEEKRKQQHDEIFWT